MTAENNITEYMRAKLEVWEYPLSDKYTKIGQIIGKMRDKRNALEMQRYACKTCQEMCYHGYNCTVPITDCPKIDCMPLSMEEALVQIRSTPERPTSDDQGFALIADATDAR